MIMLGYIVSIAFVLCLLAIPITAFFLVFIERGKQIVSLESQIVKLVEGNREVRDLQREINELKSKRDLGPVEEAGYLLSKFLKDSSLELIDDHRIGNSG